MPHEPLLTSVVGSHAHPGWFAASIAAASRGEYGPADLAELLADGVDLAIRDQERAGIDVISDGEMRRAGFFTAEFYRHLTGVRPLPPDRRLGVGAHDGLHRFAVTDAIAAPDGLGVVGEYVAARARTDKPLKVTLPGPFTLSGRVTYGAGEVYPSRVAAAEAFVPILRAEIAALVDAGASIIQVDEPPRSPRRLRDPVQCRDRACGRAGDARRAPVLRELPGPAARAAVVPPDRRGHARVHGRRARPRVREPRDERGRHPA